MLRIAAASGSYIPNEYSEPINRMITSIHLNFDRWIIKAVSRLVTS